MGIGYVAVVVARIGSEDRDWVMVQFRCGWVSGGWTWFRRAGGRVRNLEAGVGGGFVGKGRDGLDWEAGICGRGLQRGRGRREERRGLGGRCQSVRSWWLVGGCGKGCEHDGKVAGGG